jgi:hypothetical protein
MRRGIEMKDPTPLMLDNEEAIEHLERQSGHREEVEAAITSR